MEQPEATSQVRLPRVKITYCTKCRWMLRAAYFGQELLSTFETSIGELSLVPTMGGIFTIHLEYRPGNADGETDDASKQVLIWDRKIEKAFPETKILKQRIRNHIDPGRNLGHSDTPSVKGAAAPVQEISSSANEEHSNVKNGRPDAQQQSGPARCEDCN